MNEQERKIIFLLLNEMAFEGAANHFKETPPDIQKSYLEEIVRFRIPEKWDGNTESYKYIDMDIEKGPCIYSVCYKYLRIIRNNIIHANKAYKPDTPERLQELLAWSERFINAVYATNTDFSNRALEIKSIMKIESF